MSDLIHDRTTKKKLWKGHLWNPSTYVETVGHTSEDTIEKYMQCLRMEK